MTTTTTSSKELQEATAAVLSEMTEGELQEYAGGNSDLVTARVAALMARRAYMMGVDAFMMQHYAFTDNLFCAPTHVASEQA